jgi:hypothetical protein
MSSLAVAWQRIPTISSASVVRRLLSQLACDSFTVLHGRNSFTFSADSHLKSKSMLCYDRRSIGQSVLVSSYHLRPKTRFLLLRHPLWREDGSVVYSCCWSSPEQSFSGPSPAGLMTIFYSLRFDSPPKLEGQVPVFISPRNRVTQLYPQAQVSLFVAFYDSQVYSGGIRTSLHTGSRLSTSWMQQTQFPTIPVLWRHVFVAAETCLSTVP